MGRKTTLQRYGGKSTAIGHVRGLGASGHGPHHWLLQRFTAVGNFVLVLYLVFSLIVLPGYDYVTIVDWLSGPVPALAMALLIVSVFWHARLGLQVMIEDYVHDSGNKFAATLALNLAFFGGAAAGLFFIFLIVSTASGGEAAQQTIQQTMQDMAQNPGGGM